MKNTINLNRIKLLLRADWIEHDKKILFHIGAIIAGILIYYFLVVTDSESGEISAKSQQLAFIFGTIGTLIYYCRYVGIKVHQPKGLFLTLPANCIEKYVALLIEGILLLLIYILIFSAGFYIISLFISFPLFMPWDIKTSAPASFFLFIFSLFFLSYITFRKYAIVITICSIAATVAAFVGLGFLCKYILINYIVVDNEIPEGLQDVFKGLFYVLSNYYNYLFYTATLAVFYLAFLKLRRKELR